MLRRIFLSLFFALLFSVSYSQKIQYGSYYTYYYRIEKWQMEKLINGTQYWDSADLFRNLVDSVPGRNYYGQQYPSPKQRGLPPGYYAAAVYNDENLQYDLVLVPWAELELKQVNDEYWLTAEDSVGNVIKDAVLDFKGQSIRYREDCFCYPMPKQKKSSWATISRGNDFIFLYIQKDHRLSRRERKRQKRNNPVYNVTATALDPGYMIINQPMFHLLDTLKTKAYLLTPKGKPYKKPVKLRLQREYDAKPLFETWLKPVKKGAFEFQMALPDTFVQDYNYYLSISTKGGRELKRQVFRISNYELRKATYKVENLQNTYYKGRPVTFYPIARDANNLPMPDARVRMEVFMGSVSKYYDSFMFISDSLYRKFFDTTLYLSPDGHTPIEMPPSMFPNIDGRFSMRFTFLNADNERQEINHSFELVAYDRRFSFRLDSNFIKADYLENGVSKRYDSAIIICMINNKDVEHRRISLPFRMQINDRYHSFMFLDSLGYQRENIVYIPDQLRNSIGFVGRKTYDSVYMELVNPLPADVSWIVKFHDKIITSGSGRSMSFKTAVRGKDPVYVYYSYQWLNNRYVLEKVIHPREKELTVEISQPTEVFPGQTVPLEITVKNYKQEGMKNVNLSAYAVNMEFPELNIPQMPYYGRRYNGTLKTAPKSTDFFSRPNNWIPYNARVLARLNLLRLPYFQLMYHPTGVGIVRDSLKTPQPQLSIYLYNSRYKKQAYYALWIDDTARYYGGSTLLQPNAFKVTAGKHTLKLRVRDYIITLPDIEFFPYLKNHIGINIDSIPKNHSVQRMNAEGTESQGEKLYFKGKTLYLSTHYKLNQAWIRQDSMLFCIARTGSQMYNKYNQRYYYPIGPLNPGKVEILMPDTSMFFYFTPEMLYNYNDSEIVAIENPELGPLNQYGISAWNFEEKPLELPEWKKPQPPPINSYPPPPPPAAYRDTVKKPQPHVLLTSYSSPNENYGRMHGNIFFRIEPPYHNINQVWFINRDSVKYSRIIFGQTASISYMLEGHYDVVLGTEDYRYVVMRNFYLRPNGSTYMVFADSAFKSYDSTQISPYEMIIRELNTPPAEKLVYVPLNIKAGMRQKDGKKKTLISGEMKINGDWPESSIILAERNGRFIAGGKVNRIGYFEIPMDKQAGTFTLKFITWELDIFVLENVNVSTGKNTVVDVDLQFQKFEDYSSTTSMVPIGGPQLELDPPPVYFESTNGTGQIRGRVMDKNSKEPLPYVQVLVYYNGNSTLLKGVTTDNDGNYIVKDLATGYYNLECKGLSYQTQTIQGLYVKNGNITYQDIFMGEQSIQMEEVAITSKQSVIQYGRKKQDKDRISGEESYDEDYNYYKGNSYSAAAPAYSDGISSEKLQLAPAFRGSRTDGISYYIDGVRVIGNPTTGGEVDNLTYNPNKEKNRMGQLAADSTLNRVRRRFSDHAYWVPNVWTDKKGKARFSVTFPDNQTQWATFVPAMDAHKNTGLGISYVKSYKPVSALLGLPRFAVSGDRFNITGKMLNLTGDSIPVTSTFSLNGKVKEEQQRLGIFKLMNETIEAPETDSLSVTFKLKTESNYTDGEERNINLVRNGFMLNYSRRQLVEGDTTFTLYPDTMQVNRELLITSNRMQLIQDEMRSLRNYSYGCTEQTASKLKALLLEKKFAASLGTPFTDDKLIVQLVKRLEDYQNQDGTWGWWKGSSTDLFMTIYAAEALQKASEAGFSNRSLSKAVNALRNQIGSADWGTRLRAFDLFAAAGLMNEYRSTVNSYKTMNLTLQERFLWLKLKQQQGDTVAVDTVLKTMFRPSGKEAMWGEKLFNFRVNEWQTSALAYQVLKKHGGYDTLLRKVRNYFLTRSPEQRNTIASATLIETFIEDISNENRTAELKPLVTINNAVLNDFPARKKFNDHDTIRLSKTGAEMTLTYNSQQFTKNPQKLDTSFVVSTAWIQDGKVSDTLMAGIPCVLRVTIRAKKPMEYVMAEIPVAAGFSYTNKEAGKTWDETHREYFDDKTSIFFAHMTNGVDYTLDIHMIPRFAGQFTLLPAKAEMMYYPEIYGNNTKRTVWVVDNVSLK